MRDSLKLFLEYYFWLELCWYILTKGNNEYVSWQADLNSHVLFLSLYFPQFGISFVVVGGFFLCVCLQFSGIKSFHTACNHLPYSHYFITPNWNSNNFHLLLSQPPPTITLSVSVSLTQHTYRIIQYYPFVSHSCKLSRVYGICVCVHACAHMLEHTFYSAHMEARGQIL